MTARLCSVMRFCKAISSPKCSFCPHLANKQATESREVCAWAYLGGDNFELSVELSCAVLNQEPYEIQTQDHVLFVRRWQQISEFTANLQSALAECISTGFWYLFLERLWDSAPTMGQPFSCSRSNNYNRRCPNRARIHSQNVQIKCIHRQAFVTE